MRSCKNLSYKLLLKLTLLTLSCVSVATTDLKQQAVFSSHPFHALESLSHIKTVIVAGSSECGLSCLRFKTCLSFNIDATNDSMGQYLCELLPVDRTTRELKLNKDYNYFELFSLLNPCDSSPCKNGGVCSMLSRGRDYSCFCPPALIGKNCQTENWIKLNPSPQCYGTKGDKYSSFINKHQGVLLSMKFIYLNGTITCDTTNKQGWNFWGCTSLAGEHMYMSVIFTNSTNYPIVPESKYFISYPKTYNIPGYTVFSPEIVFPQLLSPHKMVVGQEYRIWFGQDMADMSENNNGGITCIDVIGLYR